MRFLRVTRLIMSLLSNAMYATLVLEVCLPNTQQLGCARLPGSLRSPQSCKQFLLAVAERRPNACPPLCRGLGASGVAALGWPALGAGQ